MRNPDSSSTSVGGGVYMSGAANMVIDSIIPMQVQANFENQSVRPDCFIWGNGALTMSGAEQEFEVAATDIGAESGARSVGGIQPEFAIGALTIAAGSSVTFRDSFDNNLSGQSPCTEAAYFGAVTLEAGASMTIQNCRVYYTSLTVDPTATISQVGCGELVSFAVAPDMPTVEPSGKNKNRYISFVIPEGGAGNDTAVRVRLVSLHHPAGPPNAPNFTAFEGQYRYLNAVRDAGNNPVYFCPDSAALGSSFACARLGCEPEYRDWAGIFGGDVVHVTGDSVVPSSQYAVAHLASSCAGNEANCAVKSAELITATERWGNVDNNPPGGTPNAIDIGFIVSKVKDAPGSFIESRCQLQGPTPNPYGLAVNALDIGRGVDAVKGLPYPFTISACP
jgi:hypothetical protein